MLSHRAFCLQERAGGGGGVGESCRVEGPWPEAATAAPPAEGVKRQSPPTPQPKLILCPSPEPGAWLGALGHRQGASISPCFFSCEK